MHPGLGYNFFKTSELINKAISICLEKIKGPEKPKSPTPTKKIDIDNEVELSSKRDGPK